MGQSWRISEKEFQYVRELLEGGFPGSSANNFIGRLEQAFADKFDSDYAVSFVNGTATLHAALFAVGVRPGDEVIVPPLTMSSTTFAVLQAGAVPVYADIEPDTFVMSVDAAARCITPRTRAIMPVSLYGLAPDFDGLRQLTNEHHLAIIEDDAQCFLGYYKGKKVGTLGDMSSFSFQNSKHITCGEGGMLISNNPEYAQAARRFSSLGYGLVSAKPGASKIEKSELYNPKFERHVLVGYNYRLGDLPAAVALAQLEKLETFVEWRQKCAEAYADVISGIEWLKPQRTPEGYINSYWAYTVLLDNPKITWEDFFRRFCDNGGDGFYGAWRLSYDEPCLRNMIPAEHKQCPNADAIQPRLMQFKTNYGDEDSLFRQAEALKKTVQSY